jgi:hypothetical protein
MTRLPAHDDSIDFNPANAARSPTVPQDPRSKLTSSGSLQTLYEEGHAGASMPVSDGEIFGCYYLHAAKDLVATDPADVCSSAIFL